MVKRFCLYRDFLLQRLNFLPQVCYHNVCLDLVYENCRVCHRHRLYHHGIQVEFLIRVKYGELHLALLDECFP